MKLKNNQSAVKAYNSLKETNDSVIMLTLPSNSSVRSARKWFAENNIEIIERSIKDNPLTPQEVMTLFSLTTDGVEDIVGKRSKAYLAHKEVIEAEELSLSQLCNLISENNTMLRMPIILKNGRMLSGFNEDDASLFMPRDRKKKEQAVIYAHDKRINKFNGYEPDLEALKAYQA